MEVMGELKNAALEKTPSGDATLNGRITGGALTPTMHNAVVLTAAAYVGTGSAKDRLVTTHDIEQYEATVDSALADAVSRDNALGIRIDAAQGIPFAEREIVIQYNSANFFVSHGSSQPTGMLSDGAASSTPMRSTLTEPLFDLIPSLPLGAYPDDFECLLGIEIEPLVGSVESSNSGTIGRITVECGVYGVWGAPAYLIASGPILRSKFSPTDFAGRSSTLTGARIVVRYHLNVPIAMSIVNADMSYVEPLPDSSKIIVKQGSLGTQSPWYSTTVAFRHAGDVARIKTSLIRIT